MTLKTCAAFSSRITRWSRSPSWITDSRVGSMPSPSRSIQAIRLLGLLLEVRRSAGRPSCSGTGTWSTRMVPRRVAEVGLGAGGQHPAQHLVGGPLHGGHRGDAEPLVDLGAARVVDAGHDLLDAERLAGHPGRDDVGVVAAGDRREGVGALDAGLLEDGLVEAVAGDLVAVEGRAEPPERVGVAVDDRHGVVAVLEAAGQRRADPAAAHDHDVHAANAYRAASGRRGCGSGRRAVALPLVGVGDVSKRILLGRKLRSSQLGETLLPKRIALPVFASDALSSVAYAPDEIFIMLSLAGASAYVWSWKIGIAVAVVMLDRRRVVPAERARLPERRRRLRGRHGQPRRRPPASPSASALLVDYVLTVAVSISSGVAERRRRRSRRSSGHEARGRASWCWC